MESRNLVTKEAVGQACKSIGLRDWSTLSKIDISDKEARTILDVVRGEALESGLENFKQGLQVELEHGTRFPDANITNNHPILTGLIVMAHFKESLDYYKLLEVAELEGDLVKAIANGDAAKIQKYYRKLAEARIVLSRAELKRIK